ncbi:hypothetical protein [Belliella buryatensis]|uniref:hypothetical protein n=1 Tax=Belliella buryatensis TaxID=1500549 RepID=UPI000B78161C|nr:hypothetical protein [Belliella buryatensis]
MRNIYYLKSNADASILFKENHLIIGKPSRYSDQFIIDDKMISPDYFDFIINPKIRENSYFVPIDFQQDIYFKSFWTHDFSNGKRYKSLFMAGNFGENYSNAYNEKLFNTINRYDVKTLIESLDCYKNLEVKDEFEFFEKVEDLSIYLIEKKNGYQIPPSKLFFYLSKFDFFFALPGMYMPISHNIIEAMSVGTIPFLQQSYADIFQPQLENGINCITYLGIEDLPKKIQYLFSLELNQIISLREEVIKFYLENLTPKSIVANIINPQNSKVYLMAEQYSVNQLSLKLEKNNNISDTLCN